MSWTTPQWRNEARGLIHWDNQWEVDPLMVDNGLPSSHDETEGNWSWQFWQLVTCTMKQDLGVLTLMAFLYFDPGSSPSCVHGSKLHLQNGPTAKNMFNLCQAYDSTFGILIFEPSSWLYVPWWVSRFSHLPTSQVLVPSSPEGAREKKGGQSLCCCLRMGEVFKDGRGESPQLHEVKQRCTKKKENQKWDVAISFFRRVFSILHGWLR